MIEFFTVEKIVGLVCFVSAAAYFFVATEKKKREIWEAIKGEDGQLQVTEVATLYWCRLFPILFFLNLLIVIVGMELTNNHLEVIKKLWYSMDTFFGFIMIGHSYINRNGKTNGGDKLA